MGFAGRPAGIVRRIPGELRATRTRRLTLPQSRLQVISTPRTTSTATPNSGPPGRPAPGEQEWQAYIQLTKKLARQRSVPQDRRLIYQLVLAAAADDPKERAAAKRAPRITHLHSVVVGNHR